MEQNSSDTIKTKDPQSPKKYYANLNQRNESSQLYILKNSSDINICNQWATIASQRCNIKNEDNK